jgi:hypothetical protein
MTTQVAVLIWWDRLGRLGSAVVLIVRWKRPLRRHNVAIVIARCIAALLVALPPTRYMFVQGDVNEGRLHPARAKITNGLIEQFNIGVGARLRRDKSR